MESDFKGFWIPAVIWKDPNLTPAEKMLVGRINHELGLSLEQQETVKRIAREFLR